MLSSLTRLYYTLGYTPHYTTPPPLGSLTESGQTEVGDLQVRVVGVARQQDVVQLEVPVHHTESVQVVHSGQHLAEVPGAHL
jgi:hypothetical protein